MSAITPIASTTQPTSQSASQLTHSVIMAFTSTTRIGHHTHGFSHSPSQPPSPRSRVSTNSQSWPRPQVSFNSPSSHFLLTTPLPSSSLSPMGHHHPLSIPHPTLTHSLSHSHVLWTHVHAISHPSINHLITQSIKYHHSFIHQSTLNVNWLPNYPLWSCHPHSLHFSTHHHPPSHHTPQMGHRPPIIQSFNQPPLAIIII